MTFSLRMYLDGSEDLSCLHHFRFMYNRSQASTLSTPLFLIIQHELNPIHEPAFAVLEDLDVPMPALLESAVDALTKV